MFFSQGVPDLLDAVADLGGGTPGARPPTNKIFFNFMGFFRKCIIYWVGAPPHKGLAPPPTTSPGFAPEMCQI